jgi:hypothetical protein
LYAEAAQSEDIAPSKAVAEQNGAAVRKSEVDLPTPTSRDELGNEAIHLGSLFPEYDDWPTEDISTLLFI